MDTEEVAKKVVELTQKQAFKEAIDTLYDKDIVSVEARTMDGSSPETRGIEGVRGKTEWFEQNMQVHSSNRANHSWRTIVSWCSTTLM